MKKILSLKPIKNIILDNIYPHKTIFNLPSINNHTPCEIAYQNLSEKIQDNGLFFEGKLKANQTHSYFHWFYFDPKNIKVELDLDPNLEKVAEAQDKKIPKGICSDTEFSKINQEMKQKSTYNFLEALGLGKNEATLIEDAKKDKNIVLISDFTDFPYNEGFFLIKDGRMLSNGKGQIKPGKYWFMVKHKNSDKISAEILTIKNATTLKENIKNIDFAFNLNPIIVGDKIITDITDMIPGTKETFVHSFRGGFNHIFEESVFEVNKKVGDMINNSQYEIKPKLKEMLKEKNNRITVDNFTKEKLNDAWNWKSGHFSYKSGTENELKTGEYHYDKKSQEFSTCLKRNTLGHTMFALTNTGKIIVFKLFNEATSTNAVNNGLLIEQLGTALNEISKSMFEAKDLNEKIVFAGIGANAIDVRTFLGLGANPGYKNKPEDNPNIKLQKLSERPAKPLYLKILKR